MNTDASSMCEKCYGFLEPDGSCKKCSQAQPENRKKYKRGISQSNGYSDDQVGLGCFIAVIVFFVIFGISWAIGSAGGPKGSDYGSQILSQIHSTVSLFQSLLIASLGTGVIMVLFFAFRSGRK